MVEKLKGFKARSMAMSLLILLFLCDLAFVVIHVVHKLTQYLANSSFDIGMESGYAGLYHYLNIELLHKLAPHFANPLLNIEMDNGYPETYQHLKFAGIIFIFVWLCIKQKTWSFIPWVLLFSYFLVDDSFQLHEKLGSMIASKISITPSFGLRRQDLGELVVTITAGLIVLPSLLLAYYLGRPPLRKIYHNLSLLLGVLVFFGVGVDMVHVVLMNSPMLSPVFGVIEDGGEMLAVSLFGWYTLLLTKQPLILKKTTPTLSAIVPQSPAFATASGV